MDKAEITLKLIKQIYTYFLRDFLYEKANDSSTEIDDYILKMIDTVLNITD